MPNKIAEKDLPNQKIIDCFLFFNEIDLLKTRLEYYGDLVDHFIITEGNTDFSGLRKPFILSKELIKSLPFAEKIIYCPISLNLNSVIWQFRKFRYRNNQKKFLWKIQDAQRNGFLKALSQFTDNDIVIFGDLDEFPSYEAISAFANHFDQQIMVCNQLMFYYNYLMLFTNESWNGTIMLRKKQIHHKKLHKIRSQRNELPKINDGGWHFSYFLSIDQIQHKIESIADVENLSHFKKIDSNTILKKMVLGKDLYDRDIQITILDENNLPIEEKLINILKRNMPFLEKTLT